MMHFLRAFAILFLLGDGVFAAHVKIFTEKEEGYVNLKPEDVERIRSMKKTDYPNIIFIKKDSPLLKSEKPIPLSSEEIIDYKAMEELIKDNLPEIAKSVEDNPPKIAERYRWKSEDLSCPLCFFYTNNWLEACQHLELAHKVLNTGLSIKYAGWKVTFNW